MTQLAIGLMSGTSCDGVSAALVRFNPRKLHILAQRTFPYPKVLRRRLLQGLKLTPEEISSLNMELGEQFSLAAAKLLRKARINPKQVNVIGSHGHTIYHGPKDHQPSTLQIGEPAVIAQRTGISVVSNFRARDIAAEGEGAPLVPYFDEAFFGKGPIRALQNIGGIANVTVVGRGITAIAFDTGPGNCLIDIAAQRMSNGRMFYDAGGRIALQGRIDNMAIKKLWRQPYFKKQPPKSTGRELFNETMLRWIFGARFLRSPEDIVATLTYFSAFSIAESYKRFIPYRLREVIVSGGGAFNRTLMQHLSTLLTPIPVRPIECYGIPVQAKEPVAFAYLALRALQGKINHLPSTTGAKKACVLGTITPS